MTALISCTSNTMLDKIGSIFLVKKGGLQFLLPQH